MAVHSPRTTRYSYTADAGADPEDPMPEAIDAVLVLANVAVFLFLFRELVHALR
jgi:hypothetical protein